MHWQQSNSCVPRLLAGSPTKWHGGWIHVLLSLSPLWFLLRMRQHYRATFKFGSTTDPSALINNPVQLGFIMVTAHGYIWRHFGSVFFSPSFVLSFAFTAGTRDFVICYRSSRYGYSTPFQTLARYATAIRPWMQLDDLHPISRKDRNPY